MASSQLAARPIPAVAGLRASGSSSKSGGGGGMSSSGPSTYTSTSSDLRRASSASTSRLGPPTSSSASQFDLQACIDILKKLQPQVSPVLPALFVTPPVESQKNSADHNSHINNKRKLQEGSVSAAGESDPKRQRRDASPQREKDSRLASSATSDASSSTSRGSHLKRSDSSSSTSTSATSISSSHAAATTKVSNNNTVSDEDHISPLSNLPSPAAGPAAQTTSAAATHIQPTQWTKERLRKIAASCREKGRALKHAGDGKMREYRPDPKNQHIPVLALLEQVDATILYAYTFWCEDQAMGSVRTRQSSNTSTDSASSATSVGGGPGSPGWKMGCNQENWKSMFGLLAFVKGRAEKMAAMPVPSSASQTFARELPRVMELIVAWLAMLEALILQHLTTNLSRNLHAQASRLLTASASALSPPGGDADSAGRRTPLSTSGSSSTSDKTSSPPSDAFLQNFLKLQNDLEKIHAQWPTSQAVLLSSSSANHTTGRISPKRSTDEDILARVLRKGKMAYDIEPTKLDDIVIPTIPKLPENGQPVGPEDLFKDEENYYHFSWPIVLHHQNSVAHATCFGRALLSEISEKLNLGYQAMQLE